MLVPAALLSSCDPHPCSGRCDAREVAATFAGAGATDCGLVPVGGDRTSLDACVVAEQAAGRAFFGLVELAEPGAVVLIRGHSRNARGELREVLGTRQASRTLVHTRPCLEASVAADGQLRCTSSLGLLIECDCAGADVDVEPSDASAAGPG